MFGNERGLERTAATAANGATRTRRTRIKFCGMTTVQEIALAAAAGADAVGVICAPESPRCVAARLLPELAAAIPAHVGRFGVMTAPSAAQAARLRQLGFTLQFSGEASPGECERLAGGAPYVKVFHVTDDVVLAAHGSTSIASLATRVAMYPRALAMFDAQKGDTLGGTGTAFRWSEIEPVARQRSVIVAGGLTAHNVAECVRTVRPYAVDVRSGIETGGRKDLRKMRAFVRAVRAADSDA